VIIFRFPWFSHSQNTAVSSLTFAIHFFAAELDYPGGQTFALVQLGAVLRSPQVPARPKSSFRLGPGTAPSRQAPS